jgi:hypothetical protein
MWIVRSVDLGVDCKEGEIERGKERREAARYVVLLLFSCWWVWEGEGWGELGEIGG